MSERDIEIILDIIIYFVIGCVVILFVYGLYQETKFDWQKKRAKIERIKAEARFYERAEKDTLPIRKQI